MSFILLLIFILQSMKQLRKISLENLDALSSREAAKLYGGNDTIPPVTPPVTPPITPPITIKFSLPPPTLPVTVSIGPGSGIFTITKTF